jgi:hypothetical protein
MGAKSEPEPAGRVRRPGWGVLRGLMRLASPRRIGATARWITSVLREIRRRRAETRLTVAVDVNSLYEPLTGIGWYLYQILAHLAERDDLRLRLYGHGLVNAPEALQPVIPLPTGPAIETVSYHAPDGLTRSSAASFLCCWPSTATRCSSRLTSSRRSPFAGPAARGWSRFTTSASARFRGQ